MVMFNSKLSNIRFFSTTMIAMFSNVPLIFRTLRGETGEMSRRGLPSFCCGLSFFWGVKLGEFPRKNWVNFGEKNWVKSGVNSWWKLGCAKAGISSPASTVRWCQWCQWCHNDTWQQQQRPGGFLVKQSTRPGKLTACYWKLPFSSLIYPVKMVIFHSIL